MLFIAWLACNALLFWGSSKIDTNTADPIGSSLMVVGAFIVLNLVFAGIWIF